MIGPKLSVASLSYINIALEAICDGIYQKVSSQHTSLKSIRKMQTIIRNDKFP
jgi:hypothetical protein